MGRGGDLPGVAVKGSVRNIGPTSHDQLGGGEPMWDENGWKGPLEVRDSTEGIR